MIWTLFTSRQTCVFTVAVQWSSPKTVCVVCFATQTESPLRAVRTGLHLLHRCWYAASKICLLFGLNLVWLSAQAMQLSFETGKEREKKTIDTKSKPDLSKKMAVQKKAWPKKAKLHFKCCVEPCRVWWRWGTSCCCCFWSSSSSWSWASSYLGATPTIPPQTLLAGARASPASMSHSTQWVMLHSESLYIVSPSTQWVMLHSESFYTLSHSTQRVILHSKSLYTANHSTQPVILHSKSFYTTAQLCMRHSHQTLWCGQTQQ